MSYTVKYIHNISKFKILSFNKIHLPETSPTIWGEFWKMFFNVEKLNIFFNDKFNDYQKFYLSEKQFFYYEIDRDFILEKLPNIINNIDFTSGNIVPKSEDIFGSYRVFNTILGYYNEYYSSSFISLNLSNGISFAKKYNNIEELLEVSEFYQKTKFFKEVITPIFDHVYGKINNKTLFNFSIYWPDEMIIIMSLSAYLKKNTGVQIILDLSSGNEQFDFSQWTDFILNNKKIFSFIDYFIIDNDYGQSINKILGNLNGEQTTLNNVIYYSNNKVHYNKLREDDLDGFEQSNKSLFSEASISLLNGKKSITSRLSPYKCYWNKCNFCAINSQNKLSIHPQYDYQYYIRKWIDFIRVNKIEHITFIDEAVPPLVLFNFAKEVLKNDLKITYFLRTRIERFYQPKVLDIIQLSGARFFGMGLESASDTTNELIGNKGNGGLSIKEKGILVRYMDRIGISVHNYAILGFPGEEEKDYLKTYVFLKNNITHSRQYTCSPNIFHLMKGPEIFQHKEKYGIKLVEEESKGEFNLSYNFTVNGKSRNMNLLNNLVNDLHRLQFAPWLSNEITFINYEDYWAYIDRSNIFYIMKYLYKDSPYYGYKNINNIVIGKKIDEILHNFFHVSQYYVNITEDINSNEIKLYDWISCKHISVNEITFHFLKIYKENKTLKDNLSHFNGIQSTRIINDINLLFDAKILKYYK